METIDSSLWAFGLTNNFFIKMATLKVLFISEGNESAFSSHCISLGPLEIKIANKIKKRVTQSILRA